MWNRNLPLDQNSVVFAIRAFYCTHASNMLVLKKTDYSDNQKLFLLSKFTNFFENMPKTFTISTKNTILHFNAQMLKETSPIISKFMQENPNESNYNVNIVDDDNVLSKFEQLYQGKPVVFKEDDLSLVQRFTQILQIKNCPNYLKPRNLYTSEIDSEGNYINSNPWSRSSIQNLQAGVELYRKWFVEFINRDEFKTFTITTKQKEYKCSIFGIYTSKVIRQILDKDSTTQQFTYDFEDNEDDFQLICDFFNGKMVDITSSNMDILKSIAEDLQIDFILQSIDNYINNFEKVAQKLDEQQNVIDSITELFELLYNIDKHGIEKVKLSIVNSEWSKKDRYVQELAAFILQVIKPSFSLQKEIADLLIELNKEANEDNRLDILTPFIVKKLMTLYWPQVIHVQQKQEEEQNRKQNQPNLLLNQLNVKNKKTKLVNKIIFITREPINLNNRCVYSFIRILYKRGIIPKEEIIKNLENYDLSNNVLNAFFLPELIEVNPKNISLIESLNRMKTESNNHAFNSFNRFDSLIQRRNAARRRFDKSRAGSYYNWSLFAQKYFPDKIELYERMLDNMEPEDEIAKSIRRDDVDELQRIIIKDRINIQEYKVLYNIFDDLEEDQSLINYSALYGSIKCFKYLKLNDGEIDDNTFYFSILGCNNEIIKIVEQNISKDTDNNSSSNDGSNTVYIDLNKNQSFVSFWYNFNNNYEENSYMKKVNSNSINKFDDNCIQYEKLIKNDIKCFLNCCNINNIIAPTIAMHKYDLFDWIFENRFLINNKSGDDFRNIAILSALSGNAHSLIAILDNGFYVTKELISYAARNGFYRLTELLLNLYDKKTNEITNSKDSFDYRLIVHFGNVSIFQLFIKYLNKAQLEHVFIHAIAINSTSIIQCIFNNLDELKFEIDNNDFIVTALRGCLKNQSAVLFDYLVDQFKKLKPDLFDLGLYCNLLEKSCLVSNLPVTKIITEIILKEEPEYDFTTAFFNAAAFKSNEICQYFIDKHVFIDFINNSKLPELGSVDLELFERIINSIDVNYKFLFYECISKAIRNKNIPVIEFILKEKPPRGNELFESIRTEDVEIVDLILKYNSKASFINQKGRQGTALCVAIEQQNYEIVERLLSIPEIDPSIMNDMSHDALLIAIIQYNNIVIFDLILNFYKNIQKSYPYSSLYNSLIFILSKILHGNRETSSDEWMIIRKILETKIINPNIISSDNISTETQTILYMACFDNNIEFVEFLLSLDNIDPNKFDFIMFNTPLMTCLEKKYTKMAELLIEHPKTNINLRNVYNESALIIAVKNEEQEIIEILLKDSRFEAQESLLNLAFIYSKGEITNQLYSNENLDVNEEFEIPNSTPKRKINALMHSVSINDKTKIDQILSHRTFNIYKSRITKSIFIAAKNNNIEVLEKLISLINNDYNIYNEERQSLLAFSSNHLSSSIIEKILKNELFDMKNDHLLYAFTQSYSNPHSSNGPQVQNILRRGYNRYSTLNVHLIAETNQEVLNPESIPDKSSMIEVMEQFLEYDKEHQQEIKFEELLPNGKSFITIISRDFSNIREVGEFLISSGVDPNKPDKFNVYPLEHAIKINSIELVKTLVNTERIDFSQIGEGITYLHLAASNKDSTILSFLLEKNVIDVNSVDSFGETPFMYACKNLSINCINVLFQNVNNDCFHCNNNGKDALEFFVSLSQDEKESFKQNKVKFYDKLISIINEMIDFNR